MDLSGLWFFKYIFVYFHPYILEETIQFDEHIFQMGWFNHQLERVSRWSPVILFRDFLFWRVIKLDCKCMAILGGFFEKKV